MKNFYASTTAQH